MGLTTPKIRDLAKRIIAYETNINKSSEKKTSAVYLIVDNLRPHLATLMGNVGFHALLSRALTLSNAEVPWLRTVYVKTDGSFQGLDELRAEVDPNEIFEGCVILFTQLLELLVAFIGENLTLRLVHEAWPNLSFNDVGFVKGLGK